MNFTKAKSKDIFLYYILPGLFIALPALLYIGYRAANLSFTHDESLSFFLANGDSTYARTPNNHLINTALMSFFGGLFGGSEFVLRVPNILAFVLYSISGILIVKSLQKPYLSVFLFAILLVNSTMFDYFGLARGYGLALGMLMVSFGFLVKLESISIPLKKYLTYLVLTLFFSQLALYSNFNALNVHLATLPVLMFGAIQFVNKILPIQKRRIAIVTFVLIFVIDFLALIPAIQRLIFMEGSNELAVFGNHYGLWQTTVKSLVTSFYFHQQDFPVSFSLLQSFVALSFVVGGAWFIRNIYHKTITNFTRIFFIFCLFLLAPVLQEILFDIPYPYGRTAILYFPVFSLVLIFLFSELFAVSKNILVKICLIAILVGVSFFAVYAAYTKRNFTNTSEWYYDKYDKTMLELIDKERITSKNPDSVILSNHWTFTPVINFYRVTRNYSWLKPVIKEDYKKADYYICYSQDADKIPGDSLQLIKSFDDISVSLYKEYVPK